MRMHLMIDLETLGQRPNCAVLSVGAVIFNKNGVIQEQEYILSKTQQLHELSRATDPSTMEWWEKQSETAREVLIKSEREGRRVQDCMNHFSQWVSRYGKDLIFVWGNGSSFDTVIMESLLDVCGVEIPWKFWNHRCYRTVKNIAGIDTKKEREAAGFLAHTALGDARWQANQLIKLFNQNERWEK